MLPRRRARAAPRPGSGTPALRMGGIEFLVINATRLVENPQFSGAPGVGLYHSLTRLHRTAARRRLRRQGGCMTSTSRLIEMQSVEYIANLPRRCDNRPATLTDMVLNVRLVNERVGVLSSPMSGVGRCSTPLRIFRWIQRGASCGAAGRRSPSSLRFLTSSNT